MWSDDAIRGSDADPCTCTLACVPQGIVGGQACRMLEPVTDPAYVRAEDVVE